NPVIVELSEELQHDDEGCLSVPGLFFPRTRSAYARCVGTDVEGAEIELAGEGLVARLIQHEVGHLDGARYIDGLERSVKQRALRQIREPLYAQHWQDPAVIRPLRRADSLGKTHRTPEGTR